MRFKSNSRKLLRKLRRDNSDSFLSEENYHCIVGRAILTRLGWA
jgi:hypothetical protein